MRSLVTVILLLVFSCSFQNSSEVLFTTSECNTTLPGDFYNNPPILPDYITYAEGVSIKESGPFSFTNSQVLNGKAVKYGIKCSNPDICAKAPMACDALKLKIYEPCNEDNLPRPVVMLATGGGFGNDPATAFGNATFSRQIKAYCGRGYTVVVTDYRTFADTKARDCYCDRINSDLFDSFSEDQLPPCASASDNSVPVGQDFAKYLKSISNGYFHGAPQCVSLANIHNTTKQAFDELMYKVAQDGKAAVNYLHTRAITNGGDLFIDHNKIFISGSSAGATWALLTAYFDKHEADELDHELANYFGSLDLYFSNPALGCDVAGVMANFGFLSNADWIDKQEPPLMAVHGTWDPLVHFQQGAFGLQDDLQTVFGSEALVKRAYDQQVPVWFFPVCKGGHGLTNIDAITGTSTYKTTASNAQIDLWMYQFMLNIMDGRSYNRMEKIDADYWHADLMQPDPPQFDLYTGSIPAHRLVNNDFCPATFRDLAFDYSLNSNNHRPLAAAFFR